MPSIDDCINAPLVTVQNIYEKYGLESDKHIKDHFTSKCNDLSWLASVPSLNDVTSQDLPSNSLVRYRCMVQDMHDPEFYLASYVVTDKRDKSSSMQCGKFQDITQCPAECELDLDSPKNITRDRLTLYCIPIPGENAWTKNAYKQKACLENTVKESTNSKRGVDNIDEIGNTNDDDAESSRSKIPNEPASDTKKLCGSRELASSKGDNFHDLNFPFPGERGCPCLVKVYDDMDEYKVNDLVEFVGVFSADPNLTQITNDSIHSVVFIDMESVKHNAAEMKQKLMEILQHALFGDRLAAEYFLCNLLSSVYSRADVMPLGKFCINLINAPCGTRYARLLDHLLANITTHSHLIEMSLDTMNSVPFSPYKDYTTDRLRSGRLQLPHGTYLILDETALQPGQLDPTGVRNVAALGTLISWQKVEYDFRYHRQDFSSNVSVIILSEGTSLLPADFRVPMAPQCDPADLTQYFSHIDHSLTPNTLDDIRRYLTVVRNLDFVMDERLQTDIQNDFVESRRSDRDNMSVDDFHSLLNLVRLLSLSNGSCAGSWDLWVEAKRMETERKQRILLLPQPHKNQ